MACDSNSTYRVIFHGYDIWSVACPFLRYIIKLPTLKRKMLLNRPTKSGVCKRNESESVSVSALRISFPSQMGRCTVFHGRCAVFWGGCTVFQGRCVVFCCGTALTYKLCILLLLDYFHPRNDGFVSCLPFTEHVQTLFTLNWACANSVLGMCRNNLHNLPCFWQFWLITMTQT